MPTSRLSSRRVAKLPRVSTTFGSMSTNWRRRYGAQVSISAGSGSRLLGGRHLSTLAM